MLEAYDDILTIPEVADILKIGTSQTYKIVRTGQLNTSLAKYPTNINDGKNVVEDAVHASSTYLAIFSHRFQQKFHATDSIAYIISPALASLQFPMMKGHIPTAYTHKYLPSTLI